MLAVASIANDNLQDLKTGQLVDATPWKQQAALVVGRAIAGSAVIPPVLDLLNTHLRLRRRRPGRHRPRPLPAPAGDPDLDAGQRAWSAATSTGA